MRRISQLLSQRKDIGDDDSSAVAKSGGIEKANRTVSNERNMYPYNLPAWTYLANWNGIATVYSYCCWHPLAHSRTDILRFISFAFPRRILFVFFSHQGERATTHTHEYTNARETRLEQIIEDKNHASHWRRTQKGKCTTHTDSHTHAHVHLNTWAEIEIRCMCALYV